MERGRPRPQRSGVSPDRDFGNDSWSSGETPADCGQDARAPLMKCVIQRVRKASVTIDNEIVGAIENGLVVLAAVEKGDPESAMHEAAKKIRELRVFADANGKMNLDVSEAGGAILAVSQFTLAGSIEKGRRPGFDKAEEPERAKALFELFVGALRSTGIRIETGRFREYMIVSLENDGPVTFVYTSRST